MLTPALFINGELRAEGRVPCVEEIMAMIKEMVVPTERLSTQAGRPGTRVPKATPRPMAAKIHAVSQRSRKDRRRGGAASVRGVSIIVPPAGRRRR